MSETKDSGKGVPILDRIIGAGDTLGVSTREIAKEMNRLQSKNDIAGMQTLFNAYKDWEIRERKPSVSIEITEELAAENFELVAKVADGINETGDDLLAGVKAVDRGNKGGKISNFFRIAVGFEPPK